MKTYEESGGYQMDKFGKQQWLPKQFLPHGSEKDKKRYEEVFSPDQMKQKLGRSFSDNDTEPYLHYCAKEIIANIEDTLPKAEAKALIKRVFTTAKTIRKSFLTEIDGIKG